MAVSRNLMYINKYIHAVPSCIVVEHYYKREDFAAAKNSSSPNLLCYVFMLSGFAMQHLFFRMANFKQNVVLWVPTTRV